MAITVTTFSIYGDSPLRRFPDRQSTVTIDSAHDMADLLGQITKRYPGLKEYLSPEGRVMHVVLMTVNDDRVRGGEWEATPISDGDHVSIVQATVCG